MQDRHLERLKHKIENKIGLIGKVSTNVMLINCYDNKGLTKEETELILQDDGYICHYHEFYCNRMSKAYEPFLEWIKDAYKTYTNLSVDEFLDACNIYMAHRPVFKSYFETGIGSRAELLFMDDIYFEIQKMYEGIISMLIYISKQKPIVFVFNKLQFSGRSTMDLLNCFFEAQGIENIVLIATFNSESAVLSAKQDVWNKLVENFNETNCIYDWDKFSEEKVIAELESIDPNFEISESFIEEKIIHIQNMCEFLASPQAYYNLKWLYHKITVEKFDVSTESKFRIYKMYIKNCAETNRISEAFEVKNNLKLLINSAENEFDYYVIQAFLEIVNGQYSDAKKTLSDTRSLIKGDQRKKDILDIFEYIANIEYWNKPWQDSNLKEDEMFIIDVCKRLNLNGLLARIYMSGFENDGTYYETVESMKERLVYYNKGFRLAGEIGNTALQLNGCYLSLMIATSFGYTDVVNYIYKERCIPLAKTCKNIAEEAAAYNGLGYNCFSCEKFEEANEYFNNGLIIHYKSNNIQGMLETLYNMSINAIMVEDYKSANDYVSTCLYGVENMRKDGETAIFHISKLYGYKALCCYYLEQQYMSKIYLSHQKRMLDYILESNEDIDNFGLWYEELFIYFYIEGLIYANGELYDKAKTSLEQALFYSEKGDVSKFFTYARCQTELAKVYMILNQKEKAVEGLKKAIEFAEEYGLKKQRLKVLRLAKEITGEDWITEEDKHEFKNTKLVWESGQMELNLSEITIEDVNERIKNIGIINHSNEERERMEFIARWSKMLDNTAYSIQDIVNNALNTFCNTFQIDNLLFINIKDSMPSVLYKNLDINISEKELNDIYEYAKRNPSEFSVSRMDKYFYNYKEIMSLFDMAKISSFMFIPIIEKEEIKYIMIMYMLMKNTWGTNLSAFILNNELLSLFSSSTRQLTDTIEREKIHAELCSMNSKLQYVALVDNLTGLFNRQGLQYNLEKKLHNKNKATAILYVDLDNFKYYNDNFGHDVGDLILVSFANIMKNICGEDGFAVRYGGDEFLVIMNLERREEAMAAAASIFDLIEKENAFIPLVERSIGKPVDISEEKRVSCSVGISFVDKYEGHSSFDIALKQADDALYFIKRNGKKRYEMWRPEMV